MKRYYDLLSGSSVLCLVSMANATLAAGLILHVYDRICDNLYNGDPECFTNTDRIDVQEQTVTYVGAARILSSVPMMLTALHWGAWSDRVGKKFPTVLSLGGMVVSHFVYLLSTFTTHDGVIFILLASLLIGLSGQTGLITICIQSYVSERSDKETRTSFLSLLFASVLIGGVVGNVLAGLLLQYWTFAVVFCCSTTTSSVAFFAALFLLKEKKVDETVTSTAPKRSCRDCWNTLIQPCLFLTSLRNTKDRKYLMYIHGVILVTTMILSGMADVLGIYTTSYLDWEDATFGYVKAAFSLSSALNAIITVRVLSEKVCLHDISIASIGLGAGSLGMCVMIAAVDTWCVFVGMCVSGITCLAQIGLVSLATKISGPRDTGKLLSSVLICQLLGDSLGTLSFGAIYEATNQLYPQSMFVVLAIIFAVFTFVTIGVSFEIRKLWPHGATLRTDEAIKIIDVLPDKKERETGPTMEP